MTIRQRYPNVTVCRVSISTQTVTTGTAQQRRITLGGDPPTFWANRDTPVLITRIKGYFGYMPNINEETLVAGTLQSWAGYLGIIKRDELLGGDGPANADPFNDPNAKWLWRRNDKDAITISVNAGVPGAVTFSMRPSGIGRIFEINQRLNVKISARENLMAVVNYTDDGTIDNASFWFAFWLWCRY